MADCKLVNAFGAVATDDSLQDQIILLEDLLVQLKILNIHLAKLSDERVTVEDVLNGDY